MGSLEEEEGGGVVIEQATGNQRFLRVKGVREYVVHVLAPGCGWGVTPSLNRHTCR